MGLLKLADKHSPAKLEEACRTALSYTQSPSYKSISNILAASQKDHPDAPEYSMYECQSFIEGLKVGARLVMELWED